MTLTEASLRDEAKRILGIRTDIAGAYTESDRARIDGIVLLCGISRKEGHKAALETAIEACYAPIICSAPGHDASWCARCDAMQDRSDIIAELIEREAQK